MTIPEGSLPGVLAARAASNPDAVALWYEGREGVLRRVLGPVSVLARELISAGIGTDAAVGVSIDRSIEMVVAIHAVVARAASTCPSPPTPRPTGCST